MTIEEIAKVLNDCAKCSFKTKKYETCKYNRYDGLSQIQHCQHDLIAEMGAECRKLVEQMERREKKKYNCSCFAEYPNKSHILKNGSWKCVDQYEKVEDWKPRSLYGCTTHCRKKEQNNGEK